MREVVVIGPQRRDFDVIAAAGLDRRYRVHALGSDLDALPDFDPRALLAEGETLVADGVVATKDRAALVAALLTQRRGLPGPSPDAVIRCQHKPTSRAIQRDVAPEATPRFAVLDSKPPCPPPFFVKPVVGRLSQQARRVDDMSDLAGLPRTDAYSEGWARIAALAGFRPEQARGFLAEELVGGDEVTLEGYVHRGRVTVIGVTDSVKYPGTGSFERFEYPSSLPVERQAELGALAARLLPAVGFDGGFFNVEFAVPANGSPWIIEVNARIASQFAPLVQALHGRSTYEALFALACGDDPSWDEGSPGGVAISYVVRVFEDAAVHGVPDPEPGVEILVRPGRRLSEQGANDAASYRLAIVYGAGASRDEALARCRERARGLAFELRPV